MCGIVAAYRRSGEPVDSRVLAVMRDTLWHRGPDDEGLLVDGHVGLGHRRLSIVDLSPAGHQPMCNEDGTVWVTFNGEIYNYVELARGLKARGHQFSSHTDTEVILHLYEEEGEACVRHLNGMFAFVIWDRRTNTLFAARDRLGIKPLYYCDAADWFLCASEIKALLAHPSVPATPDHRALADYLFTGYALGEKTMFAGIKQLPPAHYLTLRGGVLQVREYWSPVYDYNWSRSQEQTISELGELLDDAVRIHCRSDAALGCHLSGGLDSSIVTALAARHRTGRLDTFSIRFDSGRFFDESPHARAVSQHVGTRHWEDHPDPDDLMTMYATLAWHQDVPMPDAAGFSYFTAARLATRHVKVALTGHGGDEAFAGYPAQFQVAFGSTAMFDLGARPRDIPLGRVERLRRLIRHAGPRGILQALARRLAPAPTSDLGDLWIRLHCALDPAANPGLTRGFRSSLGGYTPRHGYLAPLLEAPTDQTLDRAMHHDLRVYLPYLLHDEDRASMAVSLESRVPLLDYRLIEFLATVPPEQKVPELVPKGLLRAVARPLLPNTIVERRDKTPFASPERLWLNAGRLPIIDSLLAEEQTLDRGVFEPDDLRRGALDVQARFTAFNIELWFRLFIDRDPNWTGLVRRKEARSKEPLRVAAAC